ncbi:hypothetical protein ACFY7V_03785 [[Kitasatospora] papulosa]|uniref:hypothetical protein n=1 Tax=Streptomyces TaxID=1883 RepID=UPI002FEFE16C
MTTRTRPVHWLAFVSADPVTGLRRGPIRWPDGTPPPPFGCRWCGHDPAMHGMGAHSWERPTDAQMIARMKARQAARQQARSPLAEIAVQGEAAARQLAQALGLDVSSDQTPKPERCEAMNHNSVGGEVFCELDFGHDEDHDCDGFTWSGED